VIQALLFDLDDTLVPSSQLYDAAMRICGVDPKGDAYRHARARVKSRLETSNPSCHNRALYLKQLVQDRSSPRPGSAAEVLDLLEDYEAALERGVAEAWISLGRPALLARLSLRYRLCILSNETARTQLRKLRAMDPDGQVFEALIVSEEVGVEKPGAAVFEEGLRVLDLPASDCVMIGDDLRRDLVPARALGMACIHTTEFFPASAGSRDAAEFPRLERLDDVEPLLTKIESSALGVPP
jgi:FMN phosphatase YigB (HAD superfamily)